MWTNLPTFGSAVVLAVLLAASYSFALALHAGATRSSRALASARLGAYGTACLVGVAALCLTYALVTHDFRLRYVAEHSDRSMTTPYLLAALWSGQDGSILLWLLLLAGYVGACLLWMGRRLSALQPYVLATLMAVLFFFCVVTAHAANPFAENVSGAATEGRGMSALLQSYWMVVHPPCLYLGFVGCTVPFAFAVAALITGRLDDEWIVACRPWALLAWLFLAVGNTLGALWAYESLGWGGYWGWDPVENAALLPMLTATALIHSLMLQERRGLLRVWNVFLVALTFFLTVFGTFLTRSGVIASVHAFARSSIGDYFLCFLGLVVACCATLVFYRWPELRGLPPSPRLRRATVVTGWVVLCLCGPGLYAVGRLPLPSTVRVLLVALCAGAFAYGGLELCWRRMTRGLDVTAARPEIESVLSREFVFLLNNWSLLGLMLFVLVATTFPLVSAALWGETVTVGPLYYNAWVPPIALTVYLLMGIGSLLGWRKTSGTSFLRALRLPVGAGLLAGVALIAGGSRFDLPPAVWSEPVYPGWIGQALRVFNAWTPLVTLSLSAFNAAVVLQEFALLLRARQRSGAAKATPALLWYAGVVPGLVHTLFTLPESSRRRYGGYIVHLGVVLAFIGFAGHAWNIDRETSLAPGQSFHIGRYDLTYEGPHVDADVAKRVVSASVRVAREGAPIATLHPAKSSYAQSPDAPVTNVAILRSVREDLYVIVGNVNLESGQASFQLHVNPLVSWIWVGCLVLVFGTAACLWPRVQLAPYGVASLLRRSSLAGATILAAVLVAGWPAPALGQGGMDDMHSHTVRIDNDFERDLFSSLRCMCGCPRDLLSTCACDTAEAARRHIREQIAAGHTKEQILAAYQEAHGIEGLAVPPDTGALRVIYAAPLIAIALGAIGLMVAVRRWRRQASLTEDAGPPALVRDDLDARIDAELRDIDE